MTGYDVLQGSASYPLVFLLVSSSDHISPLTGATPTVTLSKNGAAFAAPSGLVSEIGSGWYKVAGNGTDTGTLGPLLLHATATGADPSDCLFPVVAYNPQSASNLGLTNLTVPLTAAQIATGVWQDATSGDFTVASSIGKELYTGPPSWYTAPTTPPTTAQIAAAVLTDTTDTSTAGSLGYLIGHAPSWYTAPTTPPTTAQIATAVWQDLTSGSDFTTAGSIGHLLVTDIDTNIGSRLATSGYTVPPTAAAIATAVLTDTTDTTTAGSLGHLVTTAPSWYTAPTTPPTTAQIAAAILATPANLLVTDASGRVNWNLAQPLGAPRALDTVADGSIEVGDALWSAVCAGAGKQTVVGTTYTIETPSTGTAIRTFTLDSSTAPTSRT
jgi:hypothetical protein